MKYYIKSLDIDSPEHVHCGSNTFSKSSLYPQ